MDKFNDAQKAFMEAYMHGEGIEEVLRTGGVTTVDKQIDMVKQLSELSLDEEASKLFMSLKFARTTGESGKIVRRLLEKAGTNCEMNDSDPYGDGDQCLVQTGEADAQILRDLFAGGGDLESWMRGYPLSMSTFIWKCIIGDRQGVERELKSLPHIEREHLLEQRVTSMRFSPLILTIAISKHPGIVNMYTGRSLSHMNHVGVVRILLKYGARPNAKEVTGKTNMAIKATKTCRFVGKPVVLDGLSKQEYNGMEGVLGGFVTETERRVFYPLDQDKKEFSVKPENIFVQEGGEKQNRMCICDKSLRPTNLVDVQDRVGSISLHEVVPSKRNDVAKFLLKRSATCLDVEDCGGTSPRKMTLQPVAGSKVNEAVKHYLEKQTGKQNKKENIKKESCENCGARSRDLGRELLQCVGCLDAVYCSKDCQRADWVDKHKRECRYREEQNELVLGDEVPIPKGYSGTNFNYSTQKQTKSFQRKAPKGCKPKQKFWIKVQSNGIEAPLLIYDKTRTCSFYLAPGNAGHKELVEKVSAQQAFMGRKSFFRAKFNEEDKCVVFPHTSTVFEW